ARSMASPRPPATTAAWCRRTSPCRSTVRRWSTSAALTAASRRTTSPRRWASTTPTWPSTSTKAPATASTTRAPSATTPRPPTSPATAPSSCSTRPDPDVLQGGGRDSPPGQRRRWLPVRRLSRRRRRRAPRRPRHPACDLGGDAAPARPRRRLRRPGLRDPGPRPLRPLPAGLRAARPPPGPDGPPAWSWRTDPLGRRGAGPRAGRDRRAAAPGLRHGLLLRRHDRLAGRRPRHGPGRRRLVLWRQDHRLPG